MHATHVCTQVWVSEQERWDCWNDLRYTNLRPLIAFCSNRVPSPGGVCSTCRQRRLHFLPVAVSALQVTWTCRSTSFTRCIPKATTDTTAGGFLRLKVRGSAGVHFVAFSSCAFCMYACCFEGAAAILRPSCSYSTRQQEALTLKCSPPSCPLRKWDDGLHLLKGQALFCPPCSSQAVFYLPLVR